MFSVDNCSEKLELHVALKFLPLLSIGVRCYIDRRTMDFTHYPNDSRLYFIRWIDRYTKPHKASTSTSVC